MVVPTKRFVVLAFLAAGVAVAAGFVPGVDAAWMALDATLALAAGIDVLAGRGKRIEAERRAAQIFSVGRANAVTIVLTNRSDRTLRGTVMDDPIDEATTTGLPGDFEIPPHGSVQLRYEITPTRRGKRSLRSITVRYHLPLGILDRQERIDRKSVV